jgi:hypothetical protein
MKGGTLLVTLGLFLGGTLVLMDRVKVLLPYRPAILKTYWPYLLGAFLLLLANVFGLVFAAFRKLHLVNAGLKLRHLDKELQTGQNDLSDEVLSTQED